MTSEITPQNQVSKICNNANNLALYIRNATGIQSKLVYYEEIFFFYFLNNVTLSINEVPVEIITRISPLLLKVLSHTDNKEYKEYKEIMDIILSKRFKIYFNIMYEYAENLTPDFFVKAFLYQAELIINIQEKNALMSVNKKPMEFSEWITKASQNNFYSLITETLQQHYEMMLDFIN